MTVKVRVKPVQWLWRAICMLYSGRHRKTDIIGMFPDKKDEIKDFIKENKISPKDEQDLPKLGAYLSTIL